jgi:hypothetical protein
MPRYEPDPSKTSAAGFEIFPKDNYEFIVGEPKAFYRDGQKGPNWGVRVALTIANEGPFKGKRYLKTLWYHTDGTAGMNKQFQMAVLGYENNKKGETAFNEAYPAGTDWSFDTDSGAVGDAWRELVGKRVQADLDIKLGDNDNEQQTEAGWRPV